MIRRRIADLDCVLMGGVDGAGSGDGPLVILLHGFGAAGDDLIALGELMTAPAGTRWVFPAAPTVLGAQFGDSRAWWPIDLDRLDREIASGRVVNRALEIPDGLVAARALVLDLLAALARDHARTDASTVVGGFSQGAMLATDVALHSSGKLAGLMVLSGNLIAEAVWRPQMATLLGIPVFQSHGTRDGLLPFHGAERLRDFLLAAGADVAFAGFPGGHEIPPPIIHAASELLTRAFR